ncbi:unnamed protein product [Phytophthora fragariaefolia]|uniref:Unnamed protein product n=1 Tax=Phytophthora fragariaefolia TaxID=1490495 RepID=A0A9W7CU53_9STRA|nr:unnamed protein product [Phytophthora fragariaefolia]
MQNNIDVVKAKPILEDMEGVMCLYPSKRCENLRAIKSNGQMHKFCQYHRDKANYNQRQLEFRRQGFASQQPGVHEQLVPIQVGGRPLLPKTTIGATTLEVGSDLELDEEYIRLIEEVASANTDSSIGKE